jgi:hypothetical protein
MARGEGDGRRSAEPVADGSFVSAEGRRKGERMGGPAWDERPSGAVLKKKECGAQ